MLSKKQLEDTAICKINACDECSCHIGEHCVSSVEEAAQTALVYRAMLERYEKEWRTGYEINFGEGEIPETETEYWEIVALLKESEVEDNVGAQTDEA